MGVWYYYDAVGAKQGPLNDQQLKFLVIQKRIVPETQLETDGGHRGKAGQVPGLFAATVQKEPQNPTPQNVYPSAPQTPNPVPSVPQAGASSFCTNCGAPVSEQAVACMTCGAQPTGHRKFCRVCGVALNSEQVVCIRCGVAVKGAKGGSGSASKGEKSKIVAGLLALLLGAVGIHKFYLGSWGWGILYILFFWTYIPAILGLVEGIVYLCTSDEAFAEKYSAETKSAFRW